MRNPNKKSSKTVLITAGPTRAYLDDVRFLSNYSSGALGFEICRALKAKKIKVIAVVGPTAQSFEALELHKLIKVETADEMHRNVMQLCRKFHPSVAVFNAAVLDFQPKRVAKGKVSSRKKKWQLELVPTKKIIDDVGTRFPKIHRIGFKLEANKLKGGGLEKFAASYMKKKALQVLVLNFRQDVSEKKHLAYLFIGNHYRVIEGKKALAQAIAAIAAE